MSAFNLPLGLWYRNINSRCARHPVTYDWTFLFFTTQNKSSQLPPFLFFFLKSNYVRSTKASLSLCRHCLCLLTSTNTLSLNTQQWRLSVIADSGLYSHQLNQRTQDNFISNNILHYCHCLFTYSVFTTLLCLWSLFFIQKKQTKKRWKSF